MQNEPITAAVQLAPHVCAPAAIVDLIAVADVEAGLGAVPPNRVLDEPGKRLGKRRIEPAGINPRGNVDQDVSAPTWPVAGRAIRMACPYTPNFLSTNKPCPSVIIGITVATTAKARAGHGRVLRIYPGKAKGVIAP